MVSYIWSPTATAALLSRGVIKRPVKKVLKKEEGGREEEEKEGES